MIRFDAIPDGKSPSLRLRPDARRFIVGKVLDANDVRVAADGTIFDILLIHASAMIHGDDNLLAASRAGVCGLVTRASFSFALLHRSNLTVVPPKSNAQSIAAPY